MKDNSLMKYSLILCFTVFFSWGTFSSALAESKYKDFPVPKECMEQVRKEGNRLHIYDWAEWWPEKLFADFSKEFGIKIVRDHFGSTDEMVAKFKLNPKAPYDLCLGLGPSTFIRMRGMNLLHKLNHNWLPNVNAYLKEEIKNLPPDPGYQYSMPDSIYFTNYVINTDHVDQNDPRFPSWKLLFEGKEYAGRVTMLNDVFEVVGTTLKYLGFSYNSDNEDELMQAKEILLRQKPWVVAYDSYPSTSIRKGDVWISHTWSGDGMSMHKALKSVMAAMPTEGTNVGADTSIIPIGAPHPAAAHLFLNYLFRTEVNALLVNEIAYTPVHKNVAELLSEEVRNWPGVIVSKEYIEKCETLSVKAVTGKGLELRMKIWEELKR